MAKGYCYRCQRSDFEVFDTDMPCIKFCRKCYGPYKAKVAEADEQIAIRRRVNDIVSKEAKK